MFQQIDILKNVIGNHYNDTIEQDISNKVMSTRDSTELPNNINANTEIVPAKIRAIM